jgi:hypothetical protein
MQGVKIDGRQPSGLKVRGEWLLKAISVVEEKTTNRKEK